MHQPHRPHARGRDGRGNLSDKKDEAISKPTKNLPQAVVTLVPFFMRAFFLAAAGLQPDIFLLSSWFFDPVRQKTGNRAGSSRDEPAYSRRGTQTSFPLFEGRSQLQNFPTYSGPFFNFTKMADTQKKGLALYAQLFFSFFFFPAKAH